MNDTVPGPTGDNPSYLALRWTTVFDALGLSWQYGTQTYECSHRLTLAEGTFPFRPDFWFPGRSLFGVVIQGEEAPDGVLPRPALTRLLNAAAHLSSWGGGGCHDAGGYDVVILGPDPLIKEAAPGMHFHCIPLILHMHKGDLQAAGWWPGVEEGGCWEGEALARDYGGTLDDICEPGFRDPRQSCFLTTGLPVVPDVQPWPDEIKKVTKALSELDDLWGVHEYICGSACSGEHDPSCYAGNGHWALAGRADHLGLSFSFRDPAWRQWLKTAGLRNPSPLPDSASPIEKRFWEAHCRAAFPALQGLVFQQQVGRYRIDFALPEHKIGIELDGFRNHSSTADITRDRQRQRSLEAAGWYIIRFGGSEVHHGADTCVRQADFLIRSRLEGDTR